jgi:hypothetical protein
MNILITGASGFLGSILIKKLINYECILYCLSTKDNISNNNINVKFIRWKFGEEATFIEKLNIDVCLHLAHDFTNNTGDEDTIIGTCNLIHYLHSIKIHKQIYISSITSISSAKSKYGQSKYIIERIIKKYDTIIIRPGLIVGDGGLFRSLNKKNPTFMFFKFIPDINFPIPYIIDSFLINFISDLIFNNKNKIMCASNEYNLFNCDVDDFKNLLQLNNIYKENYYLISIPVNMIILFFKIIKFLNIKFPFKVDQFNSLLDFRNINHLSSVKNKL